MTTEEANRFIVNYYPESARIEKLEEELIELLHAIKRYKKGEICKADYAFVEEIADVKNVLMQLVMTLPEESSKLVDVIMEQKALRTINRIRGEDGSEI